MSVKEKKNPNFDCQMDMTCLTGTLGASDNLSVLSTCSLTTIFSKTNAARYLRSALYFKKITVPSAQAAE